MKQRILVQGDPNLLEKNEILVTEAEGYTILRERTLKGIETYVVVPLEEFRKTMLKVLQKENNNEV